LGHLQRLLAELGHVVPIRSFEESYRTIHTAEVLALMEKGDPSWERMVPPNVGPWTMIMGRIFPNGLLLRASRGAEAWSGPVAAAAFGIGGYVTASRLIRTTASCGPVR
jgi:hypothetical protein